MMISAMWLAGRHFIPVSVTTLSTSAVLLRCVTLLQHALSHQPATFKTLKQLQQLMVLIKMCMKTVFIRLLF